MGFAARRPARESSLTTQRVMQLARFAYVRKAISGALERAVPERVEVSNGGRYVRFRIAPPSSFHPALFATIAVGGRGTKVVIGTPKSAIKKPAALASFLKRLGARGLKTEARRSLIYQLRAAGIIGGARTQSVLVPVDRVLAAAGRFGGGRAQRAAANPILATMGFNPGRRSAAKNAYACYKCGKQIKGEVTHHVPPILHERLGIDFRKAFHAGCYKEWQAEGARELGIKPNPLSGFVLARGTGTSKRYIETAHAGGAMGAGLTRSIQSARAFSRTDAKRVAAALSGTFGPLRLERAATRSNPLTRKESVDLLQFSKSMASSARRSQREGRAVEAGWKAGEARGVARSVQRYGIRRAGRAADRISARAGDTAMAAGLYRTAANNPGSGTVEIKVPFRDGQKITPARMRAWIDSLPVNPITANIKKRFEKGLAQYKKFHLGTEPTSFTYRAIAMGSQGSRITDVDVVVSEGKEWAAPYQVPSSSGKYDPRVQGRYIHAHGESKMDVDIKKAAPTKLLPERFHTADGKFVGVVPSRNVKITDWYRG